MWIPLWAWGLIILWFIWGTALSIKEDKEIEEIKTQLEKLKREKLLS